MARQEGAADAEHDPRTVDGPVVLMTGHGWGLGAGGATSAQTRLPVKTHIPDLKPLNRFIYSSG